MIVVERYLSQVADGISQQPNGVCDCRGQPEISANPKTQYAEYAYGEVRHTNFVFIGAGGPADGSGGLHRSKHMSVRREHAHHANVEKKKINQVGCRDGVCTAAPLGREQHMDRSSHNSQQSEKEVEHVAARWSSGPSRERPAHNAGETHLALVCLRLCRLLLRRGLGLRLWLLARLWLWRRSLLWFRLRRRFGLLRIRTNDRLRDGMGRGVWVWFRLRMFGLRCCVRICLRLWLWIRLWCWARLCTRIWTCARIRFCPRIRLCAWIWVRTGIWFCARVWLRTGIWVRTRVWFCIWIWFCTRVWFCSGIWFGTRIRFRTRIWLCAGIRPCTRIWFGLRLRRRVWIGPRARWGIRRSPRFAIRWPVIRMIRRAVVRRAIAPIAAVSGTVVVVHRARMVPIVRRTIWIS